MRGMSPNPLSGVGRRRNFMDIYSIILAGGGGQRLWPLSVEQTPKQFLKLLDAATLFQTTVQRLAVYPGTDGLKVVCGRTHSGEVIKELRDLGLDPEGRLITEPLARNTGPAILLAILQLQGTAPEPVKEDPILVVLPADHVISDPEAFQSCLKRAVHAAREGVIVTLGVVPDRPATGYGYIETGKGNGDSPVLQVKKFVEKPDEQTARRYLESGRFFWNAGIFVFRASVMLGELTRYQPEMVRGLRRYLNGFPETYAQLPNLSIDYAVMEYTRKAVVIPAKIGWTDLGNWSVVHRHSQKDEQGNSSYGNVSLHDCHNSYFRSEERYIAGLGVKDLVVVATGDGVLVADQKRCGEVREIAGRHKSAEPETPVIHRPWGSMSMLGTTSDYKVKRLDILPGKRISLQLHKNRTEYWVVVRGRARVTRGDEVITLVPGDTTVIPALTRHRIENPGAELLSLIEVQLGTYFGEDDIVRFQDDFGRADTSPDPG